MKTRFSLLCLTTACTTLLTPSLLRAADAPAWQMTVQTDKPGAKINPGFYGLMTEEINHAYDGGLYAELIQNRVFKDNDRDPIHWSLVRDGASTGTMSLDKSSPLNPSLPNSLKLEITTVGERVGVANEGFCNYSKRGGGRVENGPGGMPVKPDTTYKVAFYAKQSGGGPLTVSLESKDGKTVHAKTTVNGVMGDWKKFTLDLKTGPGVTPSLDNRFVIAATKPGTLWLSYVSLFPPTYKNRPNGNRIDLSEKLAAMKPAFLRFPGGNYVDPGHYLWKNTIGPVEQRPGNPGAWDYRTCEGLGLLEFYLWCEDLDMEPLLAVSVGRPWKKGTEDVSDLVQDALDEIEYSIGDANTTWGAKRAADGHPAPFKLRYVEIGNEDFFDPKATYEFRYPQFHKAIKAKYPQLKLISTRRDMFTATPDLIDDHIYANAHEMARAGAKYDAYDRKKPKIFVGEWATQDGKPTPTMRGALGDAAYLCGLERNADVIEMACYAPLFTSVLPNGAQWPTNLIGYDALNSFGSPSYYMQVMFNHNKGDVVLPVGLSQTGAPTQTTQRPHGGVGFGTYDTQAEFKDLKVTLPNGSTYPAVGTAISESSLKRERGDWKIQTGTYTQTGNQQFARLTTGDPTWNDYTYTLKARKTGGREGFLVYFHVADRDNHIFWNLGGWGNQRSGLEQTVDGTKETIGENADIKIENNRWYDIKVEVKDRNIRCYLDGKLVTEATEPPALPRIPVYASATRDNATGDLILKVVNMGDGPQNMKIDLAGLAKAPAQGTLEVLSGDPDGMNSIEEPEKISPKKENFAAPGKTFDHAFPPSSVSVIRLKN